MPINCVLRFLRGAYVVVHVENSLSMKWKIDL